MGIALELPSDSGFIPTEFMGNAAIRHTFSLEQKDPVALFLIKLNVMFCRTTPSISPKVALLN